MTAADSPLEIEGLDFGEAWEQPVFPWVIALRNRTEHPLTVQQVQTSCECTVVESQPVTLAPGQSQPLRLFLDIAPPEPQPLPRDFSVDLTFRFRDDHHPPLTAVPLTAVLRGRVLANPITVDPRDLNMGEAVVTNPSTYERTIPLSLGAAAPQLQAAVEPDVPVQVEYEAANGSTSAELRISIDRDVPPGPFQFLVSLKTPTGDAPRRLALYLPVHGVVVDDILAVPSRLMLGARPVGHEFVEDVSFQSRTGRPIQSADVLDAPAGWELKPHDDVASGRHSASFRLSGTIEQTGRQKLELRVQFTFIEDDRPVVATLPIEYYALGGAD